MGFGKDGKGAMIRERTTVALSTLAAGTAIKLTGGVTLQEDFRILKSQLTAIVHGLTAGDGVGLLLGICNGELSAAEIAEAINTDGPADRNDRVEQEEAERWVKVLGALEGAIESTTVMFHNAEGGPIITSKDRWTYSDPEGWAFFVFNATGSVMSTGANAEVTATHFGVWVT